MKSKLLCIGFALLTSLSIKAQRAVDYVDPFIGTTNFSVCNPGAVCPDGMMSVCPFNVMGSDLNPNDKDARWWSAPYEYHNKYFTGFAHVTLSGVGCPEMGTLLLMPTAGTLDVDYHHYGSTYKNEKARPGYYSNTLDKYGIQCEVTSTLRSSIERFTFPKGRGNILLNIGDGLTNEVGGMVRKVSDTEIEGFRLLGTFCYNPQAVFPMYFVVKVNKKPVSTGYWKKQPTMTAEAAWDHDSGRYKLYTRYGKEMAGNEIGYYFTYDCQQDEQIEVKVGVSFVSIANARANMDAEQEGFDFEKVCQQAHDRWETALDKVTVEGGTDAQKRIFYTALYHALLHPNILQDVNGEYPKMESDAIGKTSGNRYTVFSLWDTYRAEHPLLLLMHPGRARDMALSMLHHQAQSAHGLLPIWSLMANEGWCMSGYHSVAVLSDVAKKLGIKDKKAMLEAMQATATSKWMEGMTDYIKYGYVPYDRCGTSASNTLEYAYDDWTIYQAALDAGDKEMAETFKKRALNYKNVFNPELGLACPKYKDGSWKKNFSPLQTYGEGFIEGNSANYSFHVPHDVKGMIECFGGDKKFIQRLDNLFAEPLDKKYYEDNEDIEEECLLGGYVHGNEPSHHVPYLYAWTSQPWKAQYWLREIMNRMYVNNIDGLHGNDDCGQMSAWYIFTAMGFYPVCPGSDQYVLGAPYVPSCNLTLPNGKHFLIKAPGVSDKKRYVKEVKLNGKKYDKLYITHKDIMAGGTLEFVMSPTPNKKRCITTGKPYSLSD